MDKNPAEGGKPKVKRKMKTPFQLEILEKTIASGVLLPSEKVRAQLSVQLGLTDRELQTWFNRRWKKRCKPFLKRSIKRSMSSSSSSSAAGDNVVPIPHPYVHADGVDPNATINILPGATVNPHKNTSNCNQAVRFAKFVNHQSAIAATADKVSPQILSGLHRRNKPGDGETKEPSELNKDASTKRDDERTHADRNNTRAAEIKPLHESYLVNCLLNSVLEKDGTNFLQWYRSLRVLLRCENKLYVFETPVPEEPPATAAKATMDAWIKHKNDSSEVACLMLISMVPDLQELFEHFGACEMLNELKVMFRGQVRQECFKTVKELFGCKMAEGSSVRSHIIKMKSYIERLKTLDYPISNESATFSILNSLPKSYDEFVQNFVMNNQEMSVLGLERVLKTAEMNKNSKD